MKLKFVCVVGCLLLALSTGSSAIAESAGWTVNTGIYGTTVAPLVFDIDNDGYKEVFVVGLTLDSSVARLVCIDRGIVIWEVTWTSSYIDPQIPLSIGDLNNDGTYEIVHAEGMLTTIARNCEDGTVLWESSVGAGWHYLAVADTDDNSKPYVYVAQHTGGGVSGYIAKLKGSDGSLVASHPLNYPCYGGVTIGNINEDDEYEILINDHNYLWCFDEDLNEIWKYSCNGESACPVLYDVNKDGYLDVIGEYGISKTSAGLILVDGKTGTVIHQSANLGLPMHITPTVCDIDKDGNAELITAYGYNGPTHVFDLVLWTLDYEFPNEAAYISAAPPIVANVLGDSDLEIINDGSWSGGIRVYDSNYDLAGTFVGWGHITVTDIDGDGYNNLIIHQCTSNSPAQDSVICRATTATTQLADTSQHYYSLQRTHAEEQVEAIGDGSGNTIIDDIIDNIPGFEFVLALFALASVVLGVWHRKKRQ